MAMTLRKLGFMCGLLMVAVLLSSCQTTSTSARTSSAKGARTLPTSKMRMPQVQQRNQMIAAEPRGDYYIGRRWFTDGTRYWGFMRRPGQVWQDAQLVVMNEWEKRQPDRLPETPTDGSRAHGYDHNSEYRIWGSFTGQSIYDPNSNLILPEFRLKKYELVNPNPGFLFYPGEPYEKRSLPPKHPPMP